MNHPAAVMRTPPSPRDSLLRCALAGEGEGPEVQLQRHGFPLGPAEYSSDVLCLRVRVPSGTGLKHGDKAPRLADPRGRHRAAERWAADFPDGQGSRPIAMGR